MAGSQIKTGAVLAYASVAFNALAGLLYTPWMINTIGASNYGLYTLAISVINFFMLDFGLSSAVSRYLSKYYAEGNHDLANVFLGLIYKIYFIITACIATVLVVVFVFIEQIYVNLTPEELSIFKVLYCIVAAYSVISFPCIPFSGTLSANEKFIPLNLCNLLQKVFTVGLIIVALLSGMGVYALVTVNAVVSVTFSAIYYVIIRRTTKAVANFSKSPKGLAKEVLGFSFWILVSQISQRFVFSIIPSVLAAVSNSWEIAIFGLAQSLEGYLWTVTSALNSMFMPKVSRMLAGNEKEESLQELAVRIGRIQLHIVGAIVVAFVVLGTRFVDCWVGASYSALYVCTLLLIAPTLIYLPLDIAHTAIVAAGEVKSRGIVYMSMAIANILLGIVLSGYFGAVGACMSICIAYFLRTGGMCFLYIAKLKLRLLSFAKATYPSWLIVSTITAFLTFMLSMWLPIDGWLGFACCCIFFVLVYFMLCYKFSFNSYEIGLVKSFTSKLYGSKK